MRSFFIAFLLVVTLLPICHAQQQAATASAAAPEKYLDNYIQVLRSDVRSDRMQIVTEAMRFTEAEAASFWPVYRNYQEEVSKVDDQKYALLKDYARHFSDMTDVQARDLANQSFTLEQRKTELKRKYFKEFEKVLPAARVARFFQVDHRLDLLVALQVAADVPLIPSN